LFIRRADGGPQHVHGIRDARLGGQHGTQRVGRRIGERRQGEARGLTRICAQDAEPARVRQDGDIASARERLTRKQTGHVEKLLERVDAQDACLVEESVDCCFGAR
jgi:hypothetical protein